MIYKEYNVDIVDIYSGHIQKLYRGHLCINGIFTTCSDNQRACTVTRSTVLYIVSRTLLDHSSYEQNDYWKELCFTG